MVQNHEIKNKQKGITLISLVVTIVIILILAGITLNITIGEDGLISKSKEITKQTKIDRDIVSKLADDFDVSLFAAIIRLRELGYYVGYIEVW